MDINVQSNTYTSVIIEKRIMIPEFELNTLSGTSLNIKRKTVIPLITVDNLAVGSADTSRKRGYNLLGYWWAKSVTSLNEISIQIETPDGGYNI